MASLRLIQRTTRVKQPYASRNFASTTASLARTSAYVAVFTFTAGLGAVYYSDSRAAVHRYLITPIIRHALDPETGHKLAVSLLESGLGPRDMFHDDERLKTEVKIVGFAWERTYPQNLQLWGQRLSNPIGLAAGFDKDGRAIDGTKASLNHFIFFLKTSSPRAFQPWIQLGGGRKRHSKATGTSSM
jgi:dihydroorotate dehydrogenase